MDMDMHGSSAAPSAGALPSSPTDSTPMPPMAMAMTFSSGTRVTLLFDGWTTTSAGAYAGAMLALFVLSILHRLLGSLRAQLEKTWLHERRGRPRRDEESGRRKGGWDRAKRLRPAKYAVEHGQHETEPLSPRVPDDSRTAGPDAYDSGDGGRTSRFWTPSGPWQWREDGSRALLEFVRAALGYLLMLAVMTFNVGVFFAVLSGILVGELVFGRYAQGGGSVRQEDGCHD